MNILRRTMIAGVALAALTATSAFAGQAGDGTKRLAIQISDNDPATFNKALNVATNFARGMSETGDFTRSRSSPSTQGSICSEPTPRR